MIIVDIRELYRQMYIYQRDSWPPVSETDTVRVRDKSHEMPVSYMPGLEKIFETNFGTDLEVTARRQNNATFTDLDFSRILCSNSFLIDRYFFQNLKTVRC